MKIAEPYGCDFCGALKQSTNHWYLGMVVEANDEHVTRTHTIIMPWVPTLADRPKTKHLCGVECVQKFVSRNLPLLASENPGSYRTQAEGSR